MACKAVEFKLDNEIKNLWNSSLKKKMETCRSLTKQLLITSHEKETVKHMEITNHSYDQNHEPNDTNQGSFVTIPSTNRPPLKPIKSNIHTYSMIIML